MAGGSFGGGNGTPENPFLISDVSDLRSIKNNMAASYKMTKDINLSYSDKWEPIGYLYEDEYDNVVHESFTGKLDGNGFSILNLDLMLLGETGLFVSVRHAEIKDVTLKGASYKNNGSYGYSAAGMFCNESFNSSFSNCRVVDPELKTSYFNNESPNVFFGFFVQYSKGTIFNNCEVVNPLINLNHNQGYYEIGYFCSTFSDSSATDCHVKNGEFNFSVLGSSDSAFDYFVTYCGFSAELTGSSTVNKCSVKHVVNQSVHSNRYHLCEFSGFAGAFKGGATIKNSFVQAEFNLQSAPEYDPYIYEFIDYDRQDGYNVIENCYSAVKSNGPAVGVVSKTFAGNDYNVINNSYSDKDIFMASGPYDEIRYPEGRRTTEQMKKKSTFIGWDFEDIWLMKPGAYPTFKPKPTLVKCERLYIGQILGGMTK